VHSSQYTGFDRLGELINPITTANIYFAVAGIIATDSQIHVTVTLPACVEHVLFDGQNYTANDNITVTLDAYQTVQIQADAMFKGNDLTGARITADKPVAVVSGTSCANIPIDSGSCDHLEEMIPPLISWGKNFRSAPIANRTVGDVFRILCKD
jgi:hypothetical protein